MMNEDNSTTKRTNEVCPICGITYQPSRERTIPTCGKPDCVREAVKRGLPITPQQPLPRLEPETIKQPALAKPRKPKRKRS